MSKRLPAMTPEQQRLVETNIRLAMAYCARTRIPPGYDADEYYSEMLLALCRCAIGFDSVRGIAFSTYAFAAFQRSRFHMMTYAGAAMRDRRRTRALSSVTAEELAQRRDNPAEELFAAEDARQQVEALMGGLTQRQEFILRQRMAGRTLDSIASDLAVTKERTRQIEAQAFDRCRANARRVRMTCAGEVD